MLAASQMRFPLSSIFGFGLVALGALGVGCSFVLDFPEGVSLASGAGGQGSAGSSTSGTAGGCVDPGTVPVFDGIILEPRSDSGGTYIGSLIRRAGELFFHGNFSGRLVGYPEGAVFPPNLGLINYMARLDDGDDSFEVMGSVSTCTATCGSLGLFSAVLVGDTPFAAGFVPTQTALCNGTPLEVQFNGGPPFPVCGVDGTEIEFDPDGVGPTTPYLASFPSPNPPGSAVAQQTTGVLLDLATDGSTLVGIGFSYGSMWGVPPTSEFEYFHSLIRFDPTMLSANDVAFIPGWPSAELYVGQGVADLAASVTIDDAGIVWATGAKCPAGVTECVPDRSYFISRWDVGSTPTMLVGQNLSNAGSFGNTIEFANGNLIVGGGYANLIEGTNLPTATEVDPFVMAVTREAGSSVVWAWPTADSELPRELYEDVLDIAIVSESSCGSQGAVYVAGCISAAGTAIKSCKKAYEEVGKQGFLAKLDLATGEEKWVRVFTPDNLATDLFMPTAIDADASGLYAAFNLQGTATLPEIAQIQGGVGTVASKVMRFTP
jgi:hypothetical protein